MIFVLREQPVHRVDADGRRSRAGRIADRAAPFGIPGEQVDGNDVLAVHEAIGRAVARGRAGDGPSSVECMTYRHHGHNEGEEAFSGNYRPTRSRPSGASATRSTSLRSRAAEWGAITPERADEIDAEETQRVEAAIEFAAQVPPLTPMRRLLHCFSDGPT